MYPLNGGDKVKCLDAHDLKCFSACLERYMSKMKLNIVSKNLVHGRSHLGFIIAICRLRLLLKGSNQYITGRRLLKTLRTSTKRYG